MPVTTEQKNLAIHKQLMVDEVVEKLRYFTRLYGINSLFIAGGYCRAVFLNRMWDLNDIDVASAYHEQAVQLGGLFASEILHTMPKFYERTGTAMVEYESEFGSIKVEFQGYSPNAYMHNEEVRAWLQKNQVENVPLMNNIYGRDFTINSLIYSLENDQMYDPLHKAALDFEKKIIRSILPAHLLVKYNPLSILRAIRFALSYDFHIHEDMRFAMQSGTSILLKSLSKSRIVKEIVRILKIDAAGGLELLRYYQLNGILLNPSIQEYLDLGAKNET